MTLTTDTTPAIDEAAARVGILKILDHHGDSRQTWNPESQAEVDAAKATFTRLKKKGYLAYTVEEDGSRGEVIGQFDPTAGRIIMAPQLVGG
jgi:hypothetical protein